MPTPADRALAERDRALTGLATVLDAVAAATVVQQLSPGADPASAVVHYVRYKPGISCLTALRVETPLGEQRFTIKAFADNDHWATVQHDETATVVANERLVVRRFPADAELRGLRWMLSDETQARARLALPSAGPISVLAYKPERRCVLALSSESAPVAVVKCYTATGFTRALQAHEALGHAPRLAAVRATKWYHRRGVIATPWIDGEVLQVATHPLEVFERVGRELAMLHQASLETALPLHRSKVHSHLARLTGDLAVILPHSAPELTALVKRLTNLAASDGPLDVPIHGDFYAKQVLVHDDKLTFLDFDELCLGDAHSDLALFAAHVERDVIYGAYDEARGSAAVAALLEGYGSRRSIDRRRFAWRLSEAMLYLAPHPFRHRHPRWHDVTGRLIARAREVLDALPGPSGARHMPSAAGLALHADAALAFAAPLLDHTEAAAALSSRVQPESPSVAHVSRVELRRHKHGRRLLLGFDVTLGDGAPDGTWFGKVRAKGIDVRAAALQRTLWDSGLRCMAEPLGVIPAYRMTLQRHVEGVRCADALRAAADPEAMGARIAESLFRLHTAAVSPGRMWSVDDELATLRDRFLAFGERLPEHRVSAATLQRRLSELAAPLRQRAVRAVIHRDFYHDQVLVAGDECSLVDLDLVATGDPALDVGNFVGHLVELAWREVAVADVALRLARAFAHTYQSLATGWASEDVIVRYAYLTLGRLTEIASHHCDRRAFVPVLLNELQVRLARRGRERTLSFLTATPCLAY